MSYPIWHSCLRLSSVIFPVSSVWLFFTPRGSEQTAILAVTAVASAGVWAFCSGHRQQPPAAEPAQADSDAGAADTAQLSQAGAASAASAAAGKPATAQRPVPRAVRMDMACEEDDLIGFDFALSNNVYQSATEPRKEDQPAAAAGAPRSTSQASRAIEDAGHSRSD